MQLNLTTDYAIRTVLYLSKKEQANAKELSIDLNISSQYITCMLSQEKISQYVQPIVGSKGGYRLKKSPDKISLLDIMKAMEKTITISHCLENEDDCNKCNTFDNQTCPIKKVYQRVQEKLETQLSEVTFFKLKGGD